MALDTYANLQTAIASWLNRSDLTSQIPDFITVAEAQMYRKLLKAKSEGKMLPRDMLNSTAGFQLTAGTELYQFPNLSTLIGMMAFTIEPQTIAGQTYGAVQLDYLSPENLDYLKQRRGTSPPNAIPGVYTIRGSNAQFALQMLPIPDLNYVCRIDYWLNPFPLSNGVNWILQKHPDAYLYGALAASAPFLMADERIAVWNTLFQTALEDILLADPLPNDRSWLRMDSGLLHPRRSGFNILTGDTIQP